MSLTVQNIIDATSNDIRAVLGNTGTDATLITAWVDRTHKDALHTSVFRHFNYKNTTQATTNGTSTYTLTPTDIRRVLVVYDTTFQRILMPLEAAIAPQPMGQTPMLDTFVSEEQTRSKATVADKTAGRFPDYYLFTGTQTLTIFPSPAAVAFQSTLNITYEGQVVTLTGLTDVLVVPEDGKDLMVAGVNFLAFSYLNRPEAQQWFQMYEQLKSGGITRMAPGK